MRIIMALILGLSLSVAFGTVGADAKSHKKNKQCTAEAINRSAFVSWVDCQL